MHNSCNRLSPNPRCRSFKQPFVCHRKRPTTRGGIFLSSLSETTMKASNAFVFQVSKDFSSSITNRGKGIFSQTGSISQLSEMKIWHTPPFCHSYCFPFDAFITIPVFDVSGAFRWNLVSYFRFDLSIDPGKELGILGFQDSYPQELPLHYVVCETSMYISYSNNMFQRPLSVHVSNALCAPWSQMNGCNCSLHRCYTMVQTNRSTWSVLFHGVFLNKTTHVIHKNLKRLKIPSQNSSCPLFPAFLENPVRFQFITFRWRVWMWKIRLHSSTSTVYLWF